MTINERIFLYRKKIGLTQEQAAERMGMKHSTYAKMELKGKIDADKLVKLAEMLNVTTETLLYGEEKPANTYVFPPEPEKPPTEETTLHQDPPKIKYPQYIPTNRELSAMQIIHNLPRNVRDKVFDYIEKIFQQYK